MGTIEKDTSTIIIRELNLPVTVEDFMDQLHIVQEEKLPETKLMPGIEVE